MERAWYICGKLREKIKCFRNNFISHYEWVGGFKTKSHDIIWNSRTVVSVAFGMWCLPGGNHMPTWATVNSFTGIWKNKSEKKSWSCVETCFRGAWENQGMQNEEQWIWSYFIVYMTSHCNKPKEINKKKNEIPTNLNILKFKQQRLFP